MDWRICALVTAVSTGLSCLRIGGQPARRGTYVGTLGD
jgi:hypothetical protein